MGQARAGRRGGSQNGVMKKMERLTPRQETNQKRKTSTNENVREKPMIEVADCDGDNDDDDP